ncbi:viral aspartic protease [Cypionkella sp.]|uniref:viral aspartic protease n=1 Tax=Cypionkella sp. TaxID=2811411 RepID=UPI002605D326|nr:viral aspartic protease [Cypionkella sp.]MDB5666445.1 viral aspartic protease [Cypionkella sp.]
MRVVIGITAMLSLTLLIGCGGGGGGQNSTSLAAAAADVKTAAFSTYVRDDNGFNRVRRDYSKKADAAVIAQFEDKNPRDPAGYRNLIALSDANYRGKMTVEVLAQVQTTGGKETVKRVLRLTADQIPFKNEKNGRLIAAKGTYYLRGQNFVWVGAGGRPIRSGSDRNGLVDLVLNFDKQTANINLRTGVSGKSNIRTEVVAKGLPFNIRSGAYGGAITVQVWDPNSSTISAIDGSLRGNIGGTPAYANNKHGMTTSGVYTAQGTLGGKPLTVDGVFVGTDPNALP